MRILYIGVKTGTSLDRFHALQRLGHQAILVDPSAGLPAHRLAVKWSVHTGGLGLAASIERYVLACAPQQAELVIVDSGELVGPSLVRALHGIAPRVININLDNPYVPRDGKRWRLFHKALPFYDAIFTPRDSSLTAALASGAAKAFRIWQAADDRLIDPDGLPSDDERRTYRSAVSFTGTWMPERGAFLAELIKYGVPLRIIGPRWERSPELKAHRDRLTLGWLSARCYQAAVAAADISIAMLSKGNMDVHTTRSLEIPTLGSLLLAERTPDHLALYDEGKEAFFWSSGRECADICLRLLADPDRLEESRAAGRARALANGHFNQPLMASIIDRGLA